MKTMYKSKKGRKQELKYLHKDNLPYRTSIPYGHKLISSQIRGTVENRKSLKSKIS